MAMKIINYCLLNVACRWRPARPDAAAVLAQLAAGGAWPGGGANEYCRANPAARPLIIACRPPAPARPQTPN